MAEQNSGDTAGPAAPRRGARPFIGPAGGQGQRPVPLRPPVSGVRPARGPFVPAAPPPAPALGTSPRRDPAPPSVSRPDSVLSLPEPSDTEPVDAVLVAPPATSATDAPLIEASASFAAVDELETPPSSPEPSADQPAYETFTAFDVTWNDPAPAAPIPDDSTASPLDVSSLGNAAGTEEIWADDIAAEDPIPPTSDSSTPAWLMDDVAPPLELEPVSTGMGETPANQHVSLEASHVPDTMMHAPVEEPALDSSGLSSDGTWTEDTVIPSADTIVAGHPVLEQDAQVDAVRPDVPAAGPWPDQLLAEYAPYIPTPVLPLRAVDDEVVAAGPVAAGSEVSDVPVEAVTGGEEAFAAAPIDAMPRGAPETVTEPVLADVANGSRVADTLNRLANRIRDGEIDVSSIAPDAPDAAVLASVLAALLGGGSSGRR